MSTTTTTRPGVRVLPAIGARVRNPPKINGKETRIATAVSAAYPKN